MELAHAHRRLLLGGVGIAVAVVLLAPRVLHHGAQHAVVVPLRTATRARPAAAAIVVDVAGAVRRPGLYHLVAGTRIADAVAAAGGVTREADETLVNLAAPLADGEQVLVPAPRRRSAAAAAARARRRRRRRSI